MCVAPKDFAQDVELIQMRDVPELFSAMGKKLRVYGERLVPFLVQTADGRSLMIVVRFVIADVRRPLLSVSALTDQGYDVSFGINSTITKLDSGSVVEMVRRGERLLPPGDVGQEDERERPRRGERRDVVCELWSDGQPGGRSFAER